MIWPPLLILVALSTAAAVAFGTHPVWVDRDGGLDVILWTRRLQWLLIGACIVACAGLIAVSVSSRRRALWLLGLAPVLLLFAQRFAGDRPEGVAVVEDPAFVPADKATFVKDDDWVVSLKLGDRTFAYPYAVLYAEPVVVQAEHDRRVALFWNARANRALALQAAPELRGRDLELVASPAGSLLVYNARHGQFVVGVTGQTPDHQKAAGLGAAVPTAKMTFAKWRAANPAGRVMQPSPRAAAMKLAGPTKPMGPAADAGNLGPVVRSAAGAARPAAAAAAMPPTVLMSPVALTSLTAPSGGGGASLVSGDSRATAMGSSGVELKAAAAPAAPRRVTLVGAGRPAAVDVASLSLRPNSVTADDRPAVLLRADLSGTAVRAFARALDDLTLRFEPRRDPKLADVRMGDLETGSLWTAAGVAVGGTPQFRGRRLQPLTVDEDVDYAVMKRWLPDLEVYAEPPPPPPPPAAKAAGSATRPSRVRRAPKKAGGPEAPPKKAAADRSGLGPTSRGSAAGSR